MLLSVVHIIGLSLTLFLSSCKENVKAEQPEINKTDKILIVYLSELTIQKTVAEIIQKQVGGDLVALELQTPYPKITKQPSIRYLEEKQDRIFTVTQNKN